MTITKIMCFLAFVMAVTATACSDDVTDDFTDTAAVDLGLGVGASLPVGWEIRPFETVGSEGGDPCDAVVARVETGSGELLLLLPSPECVTTEDPGNGSHGTYIDISDVGEPRSIEKSHVPAGELVVFEQDYYECTNDCSYYVDRVGLLKFDDPPDEDHPTLMIVDSTGDLPDGVITQVAEVVYGL